MKRTHFQSSEMFNKIIKRAHRKASSSSTAAKSDSNFPHAPLPPISPIPFPETTIENLPLLQTAPIQNRQTLISQKLQLLTNPNHNIELKSRTLTELIDFIQSGVEKLTESNQSQLIHTITLNIHRTLPLNNNNEYLNNIEPDNEEHDPYLEPSWPHLQLLYELLLRYIVSSDTDTKTAKKFIDNSFILKLLELFESEDPREREYLKTILHRIYGKFMVHRPFIRKSINNVFYRFIYESGQGRHCGIGELLEILGSIINGFALPMKEEHKVFLVRVLIPLHKGKGIAMYHQQLAYCVTQFVEKDYKLAGTVIMGLLRFWPVTNSCKEVLFLGELEEVLDGTQGVEFRDCVVPLFRRIASCLNSSHFQVAERALFMWNNEHIFGLIAQNRNVILPLIFDAMEKNIQSHWNRTVHGLTVNVRKMFLDMDSELFEACQKQYSERGAQLREIEEKREIVWQRLAAQGR